MTYLLSILVLTLGIFLIWKSKFLNFSIISRKYFVMALALKILAGAVFMWVYTDYYSERQEADVYKYFDDGLILRSVASESGSDFFVLMTGMGDVESLTNKHLSDTRFWDSNPSLQMFNDNRFIIRFHAALALLSGGELVFHIAIGILLSFIGLLLLHRSLVHFTALPEWTVFTIIFLLPSLSFWTSSFLKENFVVLGLGLTFNSLLNFSIRPNRIIGIIVGFILLAISKIYVLMAFIPAFSAYLWSRDRQDGKTVWRYLVINLLTLGLVLNVGLYFPEYNILEIIRQKQADFICLAEWMGAGSNVYLPSLDSDLTSFIQASPIALYNAILRPTPLDYNGVFSIPFILETLIIILFIILALINRKTIGESRINFTLLCLNYTLIIALLIGWTTPVIGAIVRYRIAFLPFLLLIILQFVGLKKMMKFVGLNPKS